VLVAAFLVIVVLIFFVVSGPAAKQVRKQETAQTATAHAASDQQTGEPVLVTAMLPVL
jgi:biopolymer transport protein ExbD